METSEIKLPVQATAPRKLRRATQAEGEAVADLIYEVWECLHAADELEISEIRQLLFAWCASVPLNALVQTSLAQSSEASKLRSLLYETLTYCCDAYESNKDDAAWCKATLVPAAGLLSTVVRCRFDTGDVVADAFRLVIGPLSHPKFDIPAAAVSNGFTSLKAGIDVDILNKDTPQIGAAFKNLIAKVTLKAIELTPRCLGNCFVGLKVGLESQIPGVQALAANAYISLIELVAGGRLNGATALQVSACLSGLAGGLQHNVLSNATPLIKEAFTVLIAAVMRLELGQSAYGCVAGLKACLRAKIFPDDSSVNAALKKANTNSAALAPSEPELALEDEASSSALAKSALPAASPQQIAAVRLVNTQVRQYLDALKTGQIERKTLEHVLTVWRTDPALIKSLVETSLADGKDAALSRSLFNEALEAWCVHFDKVASGNWSYHPAATLGNTLTGFVNTGFELGNAVPVAYELMISIILKGAPLGNAQDLAYCLFGLRAGIDAKILDVDTPDIRKVFQKLIAQVHVPNFAVDAPSVACSIISCLAITFVAGITSAAEILKALELAITTLGTAKRARTAEEIGTSLNGLVTCLRGRVISKTTPGLPQAIDAMFQAFSKCGLDDQVCYACAGALDAIATAEIACPSAKGAAQRLKGYKYKGSLKLASPDAAIDPYLTALAPQSGNAWDTPLIFDTDAPALAEQRQPATPQQRIALQGLVNKGSGLLRTLSQRTMVERLIELTALWTNPAVLASILRTDLADSPDARRLLSQVDQTFVIWVLRYPTLHVMGAKGNAQVPVVALAALLESVVQAKLDVAVETAAAYKLMLKLVPGQSLWFATGADVARCSGAIKAGLEAGILSRETPRITEAFLALDAALAAPAIAGYKPEDIAPCMAAVASSVEHAIFYDTELAGDAFNRLVAKLAAFPTWPAPEVGKVLILLRSFRDAGLLTGNTPVIKEALPRLTSAIAAVAPTQSQSNAAWISGCFDGLGVALELGLLPKGSAELDNAFKKLVSLVNAGYMSQGSSLQVATCFGGLRSALRLGAMNKATTGIGKTFHVLSESIVQDELDRKAFESYIDFLQLADTLGIHADEGDAQSPPSLLPQDVQDAIALLLQRGQSAHASDVAEAFVAVHAALEEGTVDAHTPGLEQAFDGLMGDVVKVKLQDATAEDIAQIGAALACALRHGALTRDTRELAATYEKLAALLLVNVQALATSSAQVRQDLHVCFQTAWLEGVTQADVVSKALAALEESIAPKTAPARPAEGASKPQAKPALPMKPPPPMPAALLKQIELLTSRAALAHAGDVAEAFMALHSALKEGEIDEGAPGLSAAFDTLVDDVVKTKLQDATTEDLAQILSSLAYALRRGVLTRKSRGLKDAYEKLATLLGDEQHLKAAPPDALIELRAGLETASLEHVSRSPAFTKALSLLKDLAPRKKEPAVPPELQHDIDSVLKRSGSAHAGAVAELFLAFHVALADREVEPRSSAAAHTFDTLINDVLGKLQEAAPEDLEHILAAMAYGLQCGALTHLARGLGAAYQRLATLLGKAQHLKDSDPEVLATLRKGVDIALLEHATQVSAFGQGLDLLRPATPKADPSLPAELQHELGLLLAQDTAHAGAVAEVFVAFHVALAEGAIDPGSLAATQTFGLLIDAVATKVPDAMLENIARIVTTLTYGLEIKVLNRITDGLAAACDRLATLLIARKGELAAADTEVLADLRAGFTAISSQRVTSNDALTRTLRLLNVPQAATESVIAPPKKDQPAKGTPLQASTLVPAQRPAQKPSALATKPVPIPAMPAALKLQIDSLLLRARQKIAIHSEDLAGAFLCIQDDLHKGQLGAQSPGLGAALLGLVDIVASHSLDDAHPADISHMLNAIAEALNLELLNEKSPHLVTAHAALVKALLKTHAHLAGAQVKLFGDLRQGLQVALSHRVTTAAEVDQLIAWLNAQIPADYHPVTKTPGKPLAASSRDDLKQLDLLVNWIRNNLSDAQRREKDLAQGASAPLVKVWSRLLTTWINGAQVIQSLVRTDLAKHPLAIEVQQLLDQTLEIWNLGYPKLAACSGWKQHPAAALSRMLFTATKEKYQVGNQVPKGFDLLLKILATRSSSLQRAREIEVCFGALKRGLDIHAFDNLAAVANAYRRLCALVVQGRIDNCNASTIAMCFNGLTAALSAEVFATQSECRNVFRKLNLLVATGGVEGAEGSSVGGCMAGLATGLDMHILDDEAVGSLRHSFERLVALLADDRLGESHIDRRNAMLYVANCFNGIKSGLYFKTVSKDTPGIVEAYESLISLLIDPTRVDIDNPQGISNCLNGLKAGLDYRIITAGTPHVDDAFRLLLERVGAGIMESDPQGVSNALNASRCCVRREILPADDDGLRLAVRALTRQSKQFINTGSAEFLAQCVGGLCGHMSARVLPLDEGWPILDLMLVAVPIGQKRGAARLLRTIFDGLRGFFIDLNALRSDAGKQAKAKAKQQPSQQQPQSTKAVSIDHVGRVRNHILQCCAWAIQVLDLEADTNLASTDGRRALPSAIVLALGSRQALIAIDSISERHTKKQRANKVVGAFLESLGKMLRALAERLENALKALLRLGGRQPTAIENNLLEKYLGRSVVPDYKKLTPEAMNALMTTAYRNLGGKLQRISDPAKPYKTTVYNDRDHTTKVIPHDCSIYQELFPFQSPPGFILYKLHPSTQPDELPVFHVVDGVSYRLDVFGGSRVKPNQREDDPGTLIGIPMEATDFFANVFFTSDEAFCYGQRAFLPHEPGETDKPTIGLKGAFPVTLLADDSVKKLFPDKSEWACLCTRDGFGFIHESLAELMGLTNDASPALRLAEKRKGAFSYQAMQYYPLPGAPGELLEQSLANAKRRLQPLLDSWSEPTAIHSCLAGAPPNWSYYAFSHGGPTVHVPTAVPAADTDLLLPNLPDWHKLFAGGLLLGRNPYDDTNCIYMEPNRIKYSSVLASNSAWQYTLTGYTQEKDESLCGHFIKGLFMVVPDKDWPNYPKGILVSSQDRKMCSTWHELAHKTAAQESSHDLTLHGCLVIKEQRDFLTGVPKAEMKALAGDYDGDPLDLMPPTEWPAFIGVVQGKKKNVNPKMPKKFNPRTRPGNGKKITEMRMGLLQDWVGVSGMFCGASPEQKLDAARILAPGTVLPTIFGEQWIEFAFNDDKPASLLNPPDTPDTEAATVPGVAQLTDGQKLQIILREISLGIKAGTDAEKTTVPISELKPRAQAVKAALTSLGVLNIPYGASFRDRLSAMLMQTDPRAALITQIERGRIAGPQLHSIPARTMSTISAWFLGNLIHTNAIGGPDLVHLCQALSRVDAQASDMPFVRAKLASFASAIPHLPAQVAEVKGAKPASTGPLSAKTQAKMKKIPVELKANTRLHLSYVLPGIQALMKLPPTAEADLVLQQLALRLKGMVEPLYVGLSQRATAVMLADMVTALWGPLGRKSKPALELMAALAGHRKLVGDLLPEPSAILANPLDWGAVLLKLLPLQAGAPATGSNQHCDLRGTNAPLAQRWCDAVLEFFRAHSPKALTVDLEVEPRLARSLREYIQGLLPAPSALQLNLVTSHD